MRQIRVRDQRRVTRAGTCAVVAIVATTLSACGADAPQPETARVERTTVAVKVNASGALSSVESQNLGFRTGAQLKELNVKIGDKVVPGQRLAKIDDFRTKNLRDVAAASVRNAKGNLDRARTGVTLKNARKSLDQAERSFDKTKSNVAAQIETAEDNERRAEVRYARDLDALEDALNKGGVPDDCRERYGRDKLSSTDSFALDPNYNPGSPQPPLIPAPPAGALVPGMAGMADSMNNICNPTTNAAVVTAFNTAFTSKSALVSARNAVITARKGGQVTIEAARTSRVTAENAVRAADVDLPITIYQLQALYDSANLALANATQDFKDTVLFSPVAGTVAAINGVLGEYVGGGSGVSSQSPGVAAPIPGVGAAASSDQAGAASSGISATRPGGAAFIVLNNLDTFQAVVPFEESDAAKVQVGQKVDVMFDSVPDLQKVGTVQAKAPSGVNISGVTNYYVTVLLDSGDPRLTTGQTAQVGVVSTQKENALAVPIAAVEKRGDKSFVKVKGPDGNPVDKEFTPGLTGDTVVEVLSGLNEGDEVLLPAPAAPASTG